MNWTKKSKLNVPGCFVEIIKAKYPTTSTRELAKELGVKEQVLRAWANSLRVYKDKSFYSKQCSIRAQIKKSVFECERIGRTAE